MPQGFKHVLRTTHRSVLDDGAFKNNEHIDVYFIQLSQRMPAEQFILQASEVRAARVVLLLAFRALMQLPYSQPRRCPKSGGSMRGICWTLGTAATRHLWGTAATLR